MMKGWFSAALGLMRSCGEIANIACSSDKQSASAECRGARSKPSLAASWGSSPAHQDDADSAARRMRPSPASSSRPVGNGPKTCVIDCTSSCVS
eukprot:891503-Amphidinium_carterae.1